MADLEIDLSGATQWCDATAPPTIPVATAVAVSPTFPNFSTSNVLTSQSLQVLRDQGFPMGLARELGNTKATYPIRFWIVDNSGSMQISDGHELRGSVDKLMLVPCTRWKELQGAVEYHATLAGLLGATTVFRLLNDPGANVGNQEFSVSGENSVLSLDEEVALAVRTIQLTEPAGVTPLTQHLNVVGERIRLLEPTLKRQGQKAVVVIATDGLPSDETGKSNESIKKEFVSALRRLQVLPVWVVVRLCTDDNSVVDYYNDLDKVLELPIECIDDFSGEAKEVSAVNKWLNYALPLHRCREMGYQHRIFDLLDERTLNKDELRELVVLLFGEAAFRNAPDAHSDWKGFCTVLEHVVKSERNEWNCNTFRLSPWIDMKQLHKTYDERCGLFGLGRKKR